MPKIAKMMLDVLLEQARAPGVAAAKQLDEANRRLDLYAKGAAQWHKDRNDWQRGNLAFSDLARAADAMLKANSRLARDVARRDLKKARDEANKHIDWIPF